MKGNCFFQNHDFPGCSSQDMPWWMPLAIFSGALSVLVLACCCLTKVCNRANSQPDVQMNPLLHARTAGTQVTYYDAPIQTP